MVHERIDWADYFASLALLIATRSPSKRLQVGAVIISKNRIISCGYNGFPAGTPHDSIMRDGHEINTIHAEQNAITDAARRGVAIEGATMYITHFPCINCAKMAISAGIQQIIYLNDYRNDNVVKELCNMSHVTLHQMDEIAPPLDNIPIKH